MSSTKDYVNLHFAVFLWGFTAILGKLISIPAVEMVFYRTLISAIGMGALILVRRETFVVSPGDLVKLLLTGIVVGTHWLTFFLAVKISNPSTALVGFATCSLWAALLEPIVKKKKIQFVEVFLGAVVVAGLYIIFSFDFQYPMGLLLGIASGITVAIFGVINSLIVHRVNSTAITFYEMIGACISIGVFMMFMTTDLQLVPTALDWLWISILALVCTVYAYAVAIELMKRLSVFFIQLSLNLEPVYGIILALLIFGEKEVMGWSFYVGTAIILAAVLLYPLLKSKLYRVEN
ncbi:MAG: EamA family transporter [Bacteroidota bacterium]